ncbi:hypothetical protein CLV28_0084 [Sediminihabitans luteus]|uniref:Uncharacterized protein n=1 Tax=Sediminihabitans luteus TaxID=1138585 RepID=A0A2M9CY63_9CELL|nr:hypothetical protein [Sediminihabitans luteus]PJJ76876.1 hypothetical protein CLV28_0084 [Sediminihabitans luteus]
MSAAPPAPRARTTLGLVPDLAVRDEALGLPGGRRVAGTRPGTPRPDTL